MQAQIRGFPAAGAQPTAGLTCFLDEMTARDFLLPVPPFGARTPSCMELGNAGPGIPTVLPGLCLMQEFHGECQVWGSQGAEALISHLLRGRQLHMERKFLDCIVGDAENAKSCQHFCQAGDRNEPGRMNWAGCTQTTE